MSDIDNDSSENETENENDLVIPSDDENDEDNVDTNIVKKGGIKIGTFQEDDVDEDVDEDVDDDVDEDVDEDDEPAVDIEDDDDDYEGGGESDEDIEEGEIDEDNESENVIVKKKTKKIVQPTLLESDDEDDEDDMEDNFLQKFSNDINKNYVHDFHPECIIHNYDEIAASTKVVRDTNNIIIDPLHRTIPFLTKYEKARILGQRAKQIEAGANPFVSVPENIIDSYIIAELELQQKKIPFIIRRPIPGGSFEYWSLKDLEVIGF
jgi:DNA-directed RNA polymerase I, II, and III subunit RPABC2